MELDHFTTRLILRETAGTKCERHVFLRIRLPPVQSEFARVDSREIDRKAVCRKEDCSEKLTDTLTVKTCQIKKIDFYPGKRKVCPGQLGISLGLFEFDKITTCRGK